MLMVILAPSLLGLARVIGRGPPRPDKVLALDLYLTAWMTPFVLHEPECLLPVAE